jgi:hypothetical protein
VRLKNLLRVYYIHVIVSNLLLHNLSLEQAVNFSAVLGSKLETSRKIIMDVLKKGSLVMCSRRCTRSAKCIEFIFKKESHFVKPPSDYLPLTSLQHISVFCPIILSHFKPGADSSFVQVFISLIRTITGNTFYA